MPPKFILISGGDISSVDNGLISASIGSLFQANGYKITAIKCDPCYDCSSINLNPSIYGERYVLIDGVVAAIDFGYFERILNQFYTGDYFITKGKVLESIREHEQPYINNKTYSNRVKVETERLIYHASKQPIFGTTDIPDICIIVIGDILADKDFEETLAEMKDNGNPFMHIHLSKLDGGDFSSLVKYIQKLKDEEWLPDMIIYRSIEPISDNFKSKNVEYKVLKAEIEDIINLPEFSNVKSIPLLLQEQNIYETVAAKLQLIRGENFEARLNEWRETVERENSYTDVIKIVIVGKYFIDPIDAKGCMKEKIKESYETMVQQLKIAATEIECKVEIVFVWAQDLEDDDASGCKEASWTLLKQAHGILIPAGTNKAGFEEIIKACHYARINLIPLLSICYGFQAATAEFAKNKLGIVDKWPYDKILNQQLENKVARNGNRRVTFLTKGSISYAQYEKKNFIYERSCNRAEIRADIIPPLVREGLRFVAIGFDEDCEGQYLPSTQHLASIARLHGTTESEEEKYMECIEKLCHTSIATNTPLRMQIMELKDHPFYVGIQYHAKCGATPSSPSPPFIGLLLAARRRQSEA